MALLDDADDARREETRRNSSDQFRIKLDFAYQVRNKSPCICENAIPSSIVVDVFKRMGHKIGWPQRI